MSETLERGRRALAAADWPLAKSAFEEALAIGDAPEARDGLGYACWWLGDVDQAVREREQAYVAYVERGERRDAARLALFISNEHRNSYGNAAAADGWETRAERLLVDEGPCPERVLLDVRRAKRLEDPSEAAARFEEASCMAQSIGARDLEIFLRSAYGRALVAIGKTDAGFVHLDEAMVRTTAGELKDPWLAADTSCNMLIACERAYDFERAADWCRVALDMARRTRHLPFFAFCRITYGSVLFTRGRWAEAEDEFVDALRRYETTHPAAAALAVGRLAELRVARGESEEARAILEPWYDHPACAYAVATLEAARGDLDVAAGRLERRLAVVEHDPSLVAPLCETLTTIHLARGDRAGAEDAGARLAGIAQKQANRVLGAMADATLGAIATDTRAPEAVMRLSRALDTYIELDMPFRAASVQLGLARALLPTRKEAAVVGARSAFATFEHLGATPSAEAAAELVRTSGGARPTIRRRVGADALTKRETEVLELLGEGLSNPLIAKRLEISAKTAEHHVCSVLAKLGVTTRTAAAVWLTLHSKGAQREKKDLP